MMNGTINSLTLRGKRSKIPHITCVATVMVLVLTLVGCQDETPDDVTTCVYCSTERELNLTYIGEAVGPDETLTYYLQGPAEGEMVVLLPGMGRGADEFRELSFALNNAGYQTVAIESRGIGRSGPILTEPSYDQFAEDIAIVLSDVPGGVPGDKVHLLGYEFGNRIVRMYAVKYPDHVGALILLAAGGQEVSSSTQSAPITQDSVSGGEDSGTISEATASSATPVTLPGGLTAEIDSFFQDLVANTAEADSQEVILSGMVGAFAFWLSPSQREPYVKHAFFAPMSDVPYYWISGWYRDAGWMQEALDVDHSSTSADWVSGGNAPMLVMQGEYDIAAPIENGTYLQETYPDRVTLIVVPDAGHAMLAEQVEFIGDHVISYLGENPIDRQDVPQ